MCMFQAVYSMNLMEQKVPTVVYWYLSINVDIAFPCTVLSCLQYVATESLNADIK